MKIIKEIKSLRWKALKFLQRHDPRLPSKRITLPIFSMKILTRNPRESGFARDIFNDGIWEKNVTNFIRKKLSYGMNIIDVGADIGYYTLLFRSHVGKLGKIYAFEPNTESKEILDHNIKLNSFENVKTFDVGLYDSEKKIAMDGDTIIPGDKSNQNIIQTKTLDSMGIKDIDMIKIDIEGAEMNALKGMKETLLKYKPSLLIEVHPGKLKDFNSSSLEVVTFVKSLGYNIEPVCPKEINLNRVGHIFCTHSD